MNKKYLYLNSIDGSIQESMNNILEHLRPGSYHLYLLGPEFELKEIQVKKGEFTWKVYNKDHLMFTIPVNPGTYLD